MTIKIESNIDDVIDSIDDVKDDLRSEIRKRVGRVLQMLQQRAKVYVQKDADSSGRLHRSIKTDVDVGAKTVSFTCFTDAGIAPHAAIVEYGTGDRTENYWRGSEQLTQDTAGKPAQFPFDSPDIDLPPEDDLFNLSGYAGFAQFVSIIQRWMETKPVTPQKGDVFTSAVLIARTIIEEGNYAHPFMRPAWFDTELRFRKAAANALRNAVR